MINTLVLGIGNTLLSDEGVGVYVIQNLQQLEQLPDNVTCMDGGTLSFTLADAIEDCDQLIVVDASELKSAPGTVKVFEADEMDTFVTSGNKKSVHEVGLADVLTISLLNGTLPQNRALVGIQPALIDWGEEPTESVKQAIPVACESICKLISNWSRAA